MRRFIFLILATALILPGCASSTSTSSQKNYRLPRESMRKHLGAHSELAMVLGPASVVQRKLRKEIAGEKGVHPEYAQKFDAMIATFDDTVVESILAVVLKDYITDDEAVAKVRDNIYDPFEYLVLRHKHGQLKTDFKNALGSIAYHVACHLRVQNIGMKTRELLQLVPDTQVEAIERCSGHDGTYAVKRETFDNAMKIARPVVRRVSDADATHFGSDCPMAGRMIQYGLGGQDEALHPISMVRKAYGI